MTHTLKRGGSIQAITEELAAAQKHIQENLMNYIELSLSKKFKKSNNQMNTTKVNTQHIMTSWEKNDKLYYIHS